VSTHSNSASIPLWASHDAQGVFVFLLRVLKILSGAVPHTSVDAECGSKNGLFNKGDSVHSTRTFNPSKFRNVVTATMVPVYAKHRCFRNSDFFQVMTVHVSKRENSVASLCDGSHPLVGKPVVGIVSDNKKFHASPSWKFRLMTGFVRDEFG
jgi:hypothetical protein